jgi:hypothetical protein
MNRHWRISRVLATVLALFPLFFTSARADDTPIMPLSDIKPGMNGEWHTVVSGTRIDSFPMQVVGIAQNFIGPDRPVIICKGLDATNLASGPVAGMSGSPVYIDGKLIGAYAYGFLYPHNQDLFGVTPIEQMLEVEKYPPVSNPWGENDLAQASGSGTPEWLAAPAADANVPSLPDLQSLMKPLPTPLFASGVSERTLKRFEPQLSRLGLEIMQAPSGGTDSLTNVDLVPGAAVSGVLMSGDFDFSGTGTVTWRQGNRILAFGHPFMQNGPTEMPMAPAEVVTVIQSWVRSFKLINVGQVVGTIYQDRLTAIAGEIGRMPRTTHVEVNVSSPGGHERRFQGEMFQDESYSPTLTAIAVLESLEDTMESEVKQTIYMDTDIEIDGHEPIKLSDTASSDEDGAYMLAIQQLLLYERLLSNPFQFPMVKSVVFHARLVNTVESSRLDSLNLDRDEVKPGSTLHAIIGLRNFRGGPSSMPIAIPIPADLHTTQLQLFVGDADAARDMDEPPVPPRTFDQVLDRLRLTRSHQNICVKLLETTTGVAVQGQNLPDLPPSVVAQFESPNANMEKATLNRTTLWETNFPVSGTFRGQITLPVRIK